MASIQVTWILLAISLLALQHKSYHVQELRGVCSALVWKHLPERVSQMLVLILNAGEKNNLVPRRLLPLWWASFVFRQKGKQRVLLEPVDLFRMWQSYHDSARCCFRVSFPKGHNPKKVHNWKTWKPGFFHWKWRWIRIWKWKIQRGNFMQLLQFWWRELGQLVDKAVDVRTTSSQEEQCQICFVIMHRVFYFDVILDFYCFSQQVFSVHVLKLSNARLMFLLCHGLPRKLPNAKIFKSCHGQCEGGFPYRLLN